MEETIKKYMENLEKKIAPMIENAVKKEFERFVKKMNKKESKEYIVPPFRGFE